MMNLTEHEICGLGEGVQSLLRICPSEKCSPLPPKCVALAVKCHSGFRQGGLLHLTPFIVLMDHQSSAVAIVTDRRRGDGVVGASPARLRLASFLGGPTLRCFE